jgi:hypothetical protein
MVIAGPSRLRRHGPGILLILAALAWRFAHLIVSGAFPVADDTLHSYYPLAASLFTQIRQGSIPEWSPEVLFGYPAIGSVDVHLFSPFHWPYLLFAPPVAITIRFLTISLASALFMYALGRGIGMDAVGATTSAIVWVVSRPAAYLQIEPMASATVAWFPLLLLCWDRHCRSEGWSWSVAAGGVVGTALLGGHVQHVYWFILFLLAYGMFVVPAVDTLRPWLNRLRRVLVGAAAMGVLGVAVAAVNVLPTLELLQDSIRSTLGEADRVSDPTSGVEPSYGRTLRALPQVLFYGAAGVSPEPMEYARAGLVPVALALLAVGAGRRFDNRLAAVSLLFLALAFASTFPPTHWLLKVIPGNQFRYPERIGVVFTFCIVLLAGRAMSRLLLGAADLWMGLGSLGLLLLLSALPIAAKLGAAAPSDRLEGAMDAAALVFLGVSVGAHAIPRVGHLARLCAGAALTVFVLHSRVAAEALILACGPAGARLCGPTSGLFDGMDGRGRKWPPDELAAVPKRDAYGPTRILCSGCPAPRSDNLALLTGHQSPPGYVSLRPSRVDRLVYGRRQVSDEDRPMTGQTLLDLMNVQHLVVPREQLAPAQPDGSLSLLSTTGSWSIIRNRTSLPRAFFVSHAATARTEEEAYRRVTDPGFDPRRQVVIETHDVLDGHEGSGAPLFVPALVSRYENERVDVEVDAPSAGWVVLLDRAAPGWSCALNGEPSAIFTGDYLFRAVQVPPGRVRLSYRYTNRRLRWGGAVTLIGLAIAAVGVVRCRRSVIRR